jgi:hypothetical protein
MEELAFTKQETYEAVQLVMDQLIATQKEVAEFRSALDKINNLNYQDDGDGETNEWAEAVCFHKSQRIAHGALIQYKLRKD